MAVKEGLPHLPIEMLTFRLDTMAKNGVHVNYENTRRHPISYPGNFDAQEGLTFRVFAYPVVAEMPYQIAIASKMKGYATMEMLRGQPRGTVKAEAQSIEEEDSKKKNVHLSAEEYFSYGVRAAYDSARRESFKCLYKDEEVNSIHLPWKGVRACEHLHNKATSYISIHISDEIGNTTVSGTKIDTLMDIFLRFQPFSWALYQGTYQKGTGPIIIKSNIPGKDRSLGSPQDKTEIAITARRTVSSFAFMFDHEPYTLSVPKNELARDDKDYVPHFSSNFIVNNAYLNTPFTDDF
ncbi:uncharacterized protein LOC144105029 [Amblyomma americanum]